MVNSCRAGEISGYPRPRTPVRGVKAVTASPRAAAAKAATKTDSTAPVRAPRNVASTTAVPASKFKNTLLQVSQALQRPFGEARLTMKMHPDAALTFWRAVEVGLPTLIIPPP